MRHMAIPARRLIGSRIYDAPEPDEDDPEQWADDDDEPPDTYYADDYIPGETE